MYTLPDALCDKRYLQGVLCTLKDLVVDKKSCIVCLFIQISPILALICYESLAQGNVPDD